MMEKGSAVGRVLMRTASAALMVAWFAGCASPVSPGKQGGHVSSPDLEPFLRSYFATWSAGDMRAYKEHFHKDAVITLVEEGEVTSSLPRDRFVMLQKAARARSKVQAVERMRSFTADEDASAATVVAEWELTKGGEVERGVDRFTLIRDHRGRWKIVSLVFYLTE